MKITKKSRWISTLRFLIFFVLFNSCGENSEVTTVDDIPQITQFSFLTGNNPSLVSNVNLDIDKTEISGRIPQDIDVASLIPTFEFAGTSVYVNGIAQFSSKSSTDFSNIVSYHVEAKNGEKVAYNVDVTKFTGLPIIYIATENNTPINSKDDYVYGDISVKGGRYFDDAVCSEMKIRGRGNSTWWIPPKKPYQMKLGDEATMLEMPEEKKWIFLAEYSDKTMIRNTIAFELGYLSNLDWTPKSTFAEVFINNKYNGTYNISQKVEAGENRVNIGSNGYLLEIDHPDRIDEDDVYFYTESFLINIKEPELEYNSEEFNFAKNLLIEFETALYSVQFRDPLVGYAKYIDVDSFIDWYLISEITKNQDSRDFSSIFMNVIPGEKIKMGPLWDFDLAFGNVNYSECEYPEGFWVKEHKWYARLFEDQSFVSKVKTRFNHYIENQQFILGKMDEYAQKMKYSQYENDKVWETLGIYVWPNPVYFGTYQEEVNHLKNWYNTRMNWLSTELNKL